MSKSRSSWKGPLIKNTTLLKVKSSKNAYIKIFTRNSFITPLCVGLKFLIYNGKSFSPLIVTSNMIGLKFGEFSFTRKKFKFNK